MQSLASRPGRGSGLAACVSFLAACVAFAVLAAPAAAKPVTAKLRVEVPGKSLARGATFMTDTTRFRTSRFGGCNGSGKRLTLNGPTALGLVRSASHIARSLRPVRISDEFDFGLLLCGLNRFVASSSAFWLYKVDHVAPEVGGDQFRLKGGEEVLWYFSDSSTGANAGEELAIEAPVRVRGERPFSVTVVRYGADGTRRPADGARVRYPGGTAVAGPDGRATIDSDRQGRLRLRAFRRADAGGSDIPSAPVDVCQRARLGKCPRFPGRHIHGTAAGDRLKGTRGPDVIRAGAGRDRINIRGGGRDRVRCGRHRDLVLANRRDRVARDCEVVRRR